MSSKKLHYEAISAHRIVSGCSNEADAALFSVGFFFLVKFAGKYLGNLCAVTITIAFHEKKKINTRSVLVFLYLRNTTRTLTAASRRREYYKYNPPQNTAR